MTKINQNAFFFLIVFLTLFSSCVEKRNKEGKNASETILSKQSRLDSLLASPVIINSELKKEKINGIEFYKSYMITENEHSSYFQDSIIRHASLHGDVVELLKNKHQEKIVFLRFNSDKLNLRYGIYIGMNMDDFFKKMPEQEIQDNILIYDSEYASLKFYFDAKRKELKQAEYTYFME